MHGIRDRSPEFSNISRAYVVWLARSHRVYVQPSTEQGAALDPGAIAAWLVSIAPAYIWLVNDSLTEVDVAETRSDGSPASTSKLAPKGRSWVRTQLGSTWVARTGNETVVARTKVGHHSFSL